MFSEKDKEWLKESISFMIDTKINEKIKPKSKFTIWTEGWFKIATPIAIITSVWWFATWSANTENKAFHSTEEREMVLERVKELPDAITLNHITEHLTSKGVHMSREAKDSVYVTRKEFIELIKTAAETNWNMKKNIDKVLQLQKEQNNVLMVLDNKIDNIKRKQQEQ